MKTVPGATEEIDQINAYIAGSNEAIAANALSPIGQVSASGALRQQASYQAALERQAAVDAGDPYVGNAGHVFLIQLGQETRCQQLWLDLSPCVDMSIGGQANGYRLGYKPTNFLYSSPE